MIKRLLFVLLSVVCSEAVIAQVTGYELVPVVAHTGDYGDGVDLSGYVTWHLFVTLTNPTDHVSAIFGLEQGATPGLPDGNDIIWEFDCNLFQHELAGPNVNDNNCNFWVFLPSMEFDSFWTIDACSACDNIDVQQAFTLPVSGIISTFEGPVNGDYFDGGNVFVDDGAIFTLNTNGYGVAGDDLKVKVAQLTTCGGFHLEFFVNVFVQGNGNNQVPTQIIVDAQNPCDANPVDPDFDVTVPLNCFGEVATVELAGGGNGGMTYELYDDNDDSVILTQDSNVFDAIGAGCYYVALTDSIGCTDTSEVFCFVEPPLLEMTATLEEDVLCFGDNTGEICVEVTGGTPGYEITDCTGVTMNQDGCFQGLSCGLCTIQVFDANQCQVTADIQVSCPAQMVLNLQSTNVLCNGACDGTITGTVDGGTGTSTIIVLMDGNSFMDFPDQTMPFNLDLPDLCPAVYSISVEDSQGCTLSEDIEIFEPQVLEAVLAIQDASCPGVCDGTVNGGIQGGSLPYNVEVTDVDGNVVDESALCAGDYTFSIIDANACSWSEDFSITEPDPISYDVATADATCFDSCNGTVLVNNLQGGDGVFTLTLDGAGVEIDNGVDSLGWLSVCAGAHTLQIAYNNGACVETVSDISIAEPEELLINLESTDLTCTGYDDGTISITCAGGTGTVWVLQPDTMLCPAVLDSLAPGVYNILIEDFLGCQSSAQSIVGEPPLFVGGLSDISHVTCGGACDGTMDYTVGGGTPDYTITLNNLLIDGPQTDLCGGDYNLLITDASGCEISENFTIEEPDPVDIIIAPNNATCTGMNDGVAAVVPIGGTGPLELFFEPDDLNLAELFAGEYPVTAVDSLGCFDQDTIYIGLDYITDMELFVW
ncbi:MAG: SprB repeat-containing protein [Flavobacteriales bacterium]|nr:SprB repeat-containing protein [Flavobacteriales bacterium]